MESKTRFDNKIVIIKLNMIDIIKLLLGFTIRKNELEIFLWGQIMWVKGEWKRFRLFWS